MLNCTENGQDFFKAILQIGMTLKNECLSSFICVGGDYSTGGYFSLFKIEYSHSTSQFVSWQMPLYQFYSNPLGIFVIVI